MENMEKSGKMEKIAQVRESQGNSFSASLRCLNSLGKHARPPKGFRNCFKNLHWVNEKPGNSLENFFVYTLYDLVFWFCWRKFRPRQAWVETRLKQNTYEIIILVSLIRVVLEWRMVSTQVIEQRQIKEQFERRLEASKVCEFWCLVQLLQSFSLLLYNCLLHYFVTWF